jgi:hypothetical protein
VSGLNLALSYPRFPVFSFKSAGLDPLTGNPRGYINGKPSSNYSALIYDSASIKDLNYHGPAIPKYYGSIGNTLSYKNISLTFRVMYQFGHYFVRNSIDYGALFAQGQGHEDYAARWQKPGDEKITTIPSMIYPDDFYRNFFYSFSESLVTKADNIRLQYINAGYTLTRNSCKWLPFNTMKVSFAANNLGLIWTANKYGIDPQFPQPQLPPTRNYTIGIQANL